MMLKVLVKKQLMEVFKGYFYDAKKNKRRSTAGIIAWFIFFAVIMIGVLGGIFTGLSLSICSGLVEAGMGWLYFALMGGIAILLGAFGSVFNTFSGLYLSKDNDLLLSMPIPIKYIIGSRLINVYLMGVLYSVVVMAPALTVYWITAGATAGRMICGILLYVVISLTILILSCLLGWCVAKISLKLKKKSFVTVIASLAFIGAYYFVYYKAQELISDLIANAGIYGAKIRGSAYFVYLFGRVGEGDAGAAAIVSAICVLLVVIVWLILKKTFLSIATTNVNEGGKVRYKDRPVKEKSVFGALLSKELAKFTSNSNYMLNCGLGILFIPALGVFLLIKGPFIMGTLEEVFAAYTDITPILLCGMLFLMSSMIDIAAPAVSLEGKSIWIPQSLPVEPKMVLRAKTALQLIFSGVPMVFALICGMIILKTSAGIKVLMCLASLVFIVFSSLFDSFLGIKMPLLSWTNEIVPIKQSGAVSIAIFGIWAVVAVFAVLFFLLGYRIGAAEYLAVWTAIFAIASAVLLKWLDTKGARIFSEL